LEGLLCPDIKNLTIKGEFQSNDFKFVKISITPCTAQTTLSTGVQCKSDEAIRNYFVENKLQMFFVNMNFDFEDFVQPTTYYVSDSFLDLNMDRTISMDWYVRHTEIEYEDDYAQIGQRSYNYTYSHGKARTSSNHRLEKDEPLV